MQTSPASPLFAIVLSVTLLLLSRAIAGAIVPNCNDNISCTVDFYNEATGACSNVPNNASCSDGVFCDGVETCSPTAGCQPGTPPNCNDEKACTTDVCDESSDSCRHVPNNSICSDGVFCNGVETCSPTAGCQPGTPPNCNDENACTNDSCLEASDSCAHLNNTTICDDGDLCTKNDICSGGNCRGTPVAECRGPVCGDGTTDSPEECDDGNAAFQPGESCSALCTLVPCGQPKNPGAAAPKTSDALFVLKVAVGNADCDLRVCDVNNNKKVSTTDALIVLRRAVGISIGLNCP